MHKVPRLQVAYVVATLAFISAAGCKSQSDGPERFQLTGTVTFTGEPVPVGFIYFNPDTTKGNRGPGSVGTIEDGVYTIPAGKGPVSGPMIVLIDGYTGQPTKVDGEVVPHGAELFSRYETRINVSPKDGTMNFEVPHAAK